MFCRLIDNDAFVDIKCVSRITGTSYYYNVNIILHILVFEFSCILNILLY